MPADKTLLYDPLRNPLHICPDHHHFESNRISWRLSVSKIELTNDVFENFMIIDGHSLPVTLQMVSVHLPQNLYTP